MTQFRAHTSGSQSLSGVTYPTVNVLQFGTEDFDTDGVFVANVFTVPPSWNGRIGELSAGLALSTAEQWARLHIQRSTDGGSSWTTVWQTLREDDGVFYPWYATVHSGPTVFVSGEKYRVAHDGTAATKSGDTIYGAQCNFFSGFVYPMTGVFTKFRAELMATGGQGLGADSETTIQITEVADPESAFASYTFTVPAGLAGKFMAITGGVDTDALQSIAVIARSVDAGSTFPWLGASGGNGCPANGAHAGVVQLSTGDQFQLHCYNDDGSSRTAAAVANTFLAGMIWG